MDGMDGAQVFPSFIERIQAHMPDVDPASLRYEARFGASTDLVRIGGKHVALFARDAERFSLPRTLELCDRIRDRITLRLPSAIARGEDMVICPLIPGGALERHVLQRLPESVQDGVADQLGRFLEELQAVPVGELVGLRLLERGTNFDRSAVEGIIESFARDVGPHLMRPAAIWIQEHCQAWLERGADDRLPLCLSHGELSPPHVFFDAGTEVVTGILDFGTCSISEPTDDLFWLIWSYGQRFVDRVVRLHPVLEPYYRKARFITGLQLMRWTLAGVQENEPAWYATHLGFPFDFVPLRRDEG